MYHWEFDDEYAYQITESPGHRYHKVVVHRNRVPVAVVEYYNDEFRYEFLKHVFDEEGLLMRAKQMIL